MKLTESEKVSIEQMQQFDVLNFDDEKRSDFQFKVEKPTDSEFHVAKFALMICLKSDYFETPTEVINFIEK